MQRLSLVIASCLIVALPGRAWAFPPTPHHLLFGTVRDERGNPILIDTAEVLLLTPDEEIVSVNIRATGVAGVNYEMRVPMDAALLGEKYRPTAMRPYAGFTLRVFIGGELFLPIELVGAVSEIGAPGGKTRLDLTLGEDLDGDGLPDAWERSLAGGGLDEVDPDDDFDGDGLSNLEEYLAGSYAGDEESAFALNVLETRDDGALLQFRALRGRTYSLFRSSDLHEWIPTEFVLEGEEERRSSYLSEDVRDVRVVAPTEVGASGFYLLKVQ